MKQVTVSFTFTFDVSDYINSLTPTPSDEDIKRIAAEHAVDNGDLYRALRNVPKPTVTITEH